MRKFFDKYTYLDVKWCNKVSLPYYTIYCFQTIELVNILLPLLKQMIIDHGIKDYYVYNSIIIRKFNT